MGRGKEGGKESFTVYMNGKKEGMNEERKEGKKESLAIFFN